MDYTIQRGDTLGAIAARAGTTVAELARLNGIRNPDLIRAGATLRVPDAPGGGGGASPQAAAENYASPYRPYNIGERVNNADGTWSSERSMTVENPIMGGYSVIPSMYSTPNGPMYLTDNPGLNSQAAFTYANRTHTMPQTFATLNQAENYAVQREANWQDPATAGQNAPLFNPVPPPNPARPTASAAAPAPQPTAPAPAASQVGSYTVQSGDTLTRIARLNNTSVEELARLNGISNPNRIGVGQVIQLPPAQGGAPLPPQNPARPGVAGPPMDRGAPMTTGGGPAGYQPAGWTPVPAAGPVPTTQQWAANRPPTGSIGQGGDPAFEDIYGGGAAQPARQAPPAAPPGNGVGMPVTPVQRGELAPTPPDFLQMNLRQLGDYMNAWVGAGRPLDQMPPEFQQVWQFRLQEARDAATQDQSALNRDHAAYRGRWGTDMRVADPAPPVDASIGEGQYLPQEMIQLGQLGANMRNAPRAQTMLPSLGLLSGPRRTQPTLGQLAYTGV